MSDSVRPQRRQPTRLPRPRDSPGKNTGVGCHFLLQCMKVKSEREVTESCLTLHDPMDCSPPGSSIHGIFQARVLEWGASAFSVLASYEDTNPTMKAPLSGTNYLSMTLFPDVIMLGTRALTWIWEGYKYCHVCVLVSQSCPALCGPVDCSPSGSWRMKEAKHGKNFQLSYF